ncbi:hypothetical protein [Mangrovivirga cuniculi]|uniref:Ig-like domain-containing protein n=1 Tax=Mangrovivirga cuniculi TaxID=2715131 RepID=A0A4D7JU17_9BACT|nr:hypothetical protein [Mangrovivirga cuniculi]QCK16112.1 hypothetical protein DCC35_15875 [Mangrovivirga cuniculi]
MKIFKKYFLLFTLALSFGFLSGCYENEVDNIEICDGSKFKVSYSAFIFGNITEYTYYISAPSGKKTFDESVTLKYRIESTPNSNTTLEIPAGTKSPVQFHSYQSINGNRPVDITIATEECPQETKKAEEDIINENENPDCPDQISLQIQSCEDIINLRWTSNLENTTELSIYGQNLTITNEGGVTLNKSEIDLTDSEPSLSTTDICLYTIEKTCSGTSGSLTISETIEGGQELNIKVTDADLNMDESVVETVSVQVVSAQGEKETVALTETSINSNEFSGSLSTILGAESGTNNDNVLTIENGMSITVTYQDEKDGNEEAVSLEKTVIASGAVAPKNYSVIYAGTTYYLESDSYLVFNIDEPYSVYFSIDNGQNSFFLTLEIYHQGTQLTSGTYTVAGQNQGVNAETSGVNVGDDPNNYKAFTGGSVKVTTQEDGYLLEMNLEEGNNTLVGSYFVKTEGQ